MQEKVRNIHKNNNLRTIIVIISIAVLIVLAYMYTAILPSIINIEQYKKQVLQEAKTNLRKYDLEVGK
jgi:hypothetical protein